MEDDWWRAKVIAYRVTHRKATRARWDAFEFALRQFLLGRKPTVAEVHKQLNGGALSYSAVSNGVRDARELMYLTHWG